MHIIVTGGGTGGHVFPAIEIAKEILSTIPNSRVTFVGNKNSLEERMAHSHKINFLGLNTKQIMGNGSVKKVKGLLFLMMAIIKSLIFLIKDRPHAIIGVGGYVSAPMVMASFLLRIPRFICEQNVVPGNANKLLGLIAHKVFLGFEQGANHFQKNKCIYSGNPVRNDFFVLEPPTNNGGLNILVIGGSQGAQIINNNIPTAITQLKDSCPNISITHQTGKSLFDSVEKNYRNHGIDAHVMPFIDDMPKIFSVQHLIISRAGAMAISEIMAAGRPSILIPYRFAAGHQKQNALVLVKKGAAKMVEEGEHFATRLAEAIKTFYNSHEERLMTAKKARALSKPDAAKIVVQNVLNFIS